jgi:hypothetical protein
MWIAFRSRQLKESASKLLEDHFTKNPKEKAKAEKILYPYLAASATYVKNWVWDPTVGLRSGATGVRAITISHP